MAPPQRGRGKTQLSMLEFTKHSTPISVAPTPPPSSRPSSQRPSPQNSQVHELPRPTAPPFFRRLPPKPRRPPSTGSPADDAWEVGERVLNGQKINPRIRYGDEGGHVHDSDTDFESDTVRHRVARERPSLKRKHLVSGLRDDRMSMTKRSANKRGSKKASIKITTQMSDAENDDHSDPMPNSKAEGGARVNDIRDDCELVLVEGEKLEMSGTEEEDEDVSSGPDVNRFGNQRRISLAGSVVTPVEKRIPTAHSQFETPEEFPLNTQGLLSHCKNAPRKALNIASGLAGEGTSIRKRSRELPRLFDSDSDDPLTSPKSHCMKDSQKASACDSDSSSDDNVPERLATSGGEREEPRPYSRIRRVRSPRGRGKNTVVESESSSQERDPEPATEPATPASGEACANARNPRQTRRVLATKTKQRPKNLPTGTSDSSEQEDDEIETVTSSSDQEEVQTPEQTRKIITRSATKRARQNTQRHSALALDLLDLADDTLSGSENPPGNDSAITVDSELPSKLSVTPEPTPPPSSSKRRSRRSLTPESSSSPVPTRHCSTRQQSRSLECTPLRNSSVKRTTANVSIAPEPTTSPSLPKKRNARRVTITPESTPSPPSTKKRRRLQRLVSHSSDEVVLVGEPENHGVPLESSKASESEKKDTEPQSASKYTAGSEWFLERQIEDFSSSSADLWRPPCVESETSGPELKKCPQKGRPIAVPPVRRKILKGLETDQAHMYGHQSPGNTPTQSPERLQRAEPHVVEDDRRNAECDEVVDLIDADEDESPKVVDLIDADEDESPSDAVESDTPVQVNEIRNSSSAPDSGSVADVEEVLPVDDGKPPPFNLLVLCNGGETVKQMKERLGEEALMDRVIEAQQAGREIIGGEEVGLTGSFNRSVFNRFSREIVGDQLGRERQATVVTEQALRGEFKFNYRGRNQTNRPFRGRRKSTRGEKKARGSGRLSNLRRRLG